MRLRNFTCATLVLMMFLSLSSVKAEPVDTTMAKLVAYNFLRGGVANSPRQQIEPTIAYKSSVMRQEDGRQSEKIYYYVVNVGQDGFVIVAADSRVSPVLAYSTTSSFDGQQLPPNMASLLSEYQMQMDEMDYQQVVASSSVRAQWEDLRRQSRHHSRSVVVAPLITSKWHQGAYYNNACPVDPRNPSGNGHAVTGCTAVAMGQIMRYWRHPVHGTGSHSYVSNNSIYGNNYGDYGTLTADFENTYYDYDNMPDSLTAGSSSAEINAVSTLLYHCGVSIDMAYGAFRSSSEYALVDDAMRNYFNYYQARHVYRGSYGDSEWINMIKNELDHLRPVFYTGADTSGLSVHSFLCDGYDNQGYFHMNWGWGGYLDGYFLLSNLNPDISYNTAQSAIIEIQVLPQSLSVSEEQLTFFVDEETPAEIHRFEVQTENIDNYIQVSVTGDFRISTDSVNFVSYLTMSPTGGPVYVKYVSTLQQAHYDLGHVSLTTGAYKDTVRLVGATYFPECASPLNLSAEQGVDADTNQVLLTWDALVPDVAQLSWDSVQQSYYIVGGTSNYTLIPMHRLTVTDLLPYHQHQLTHIAFVAESSALEYRLRVYQGGQYTSRDQRLNPGTLICDQPVSLSSLTMGAWNTVELNEPIVIDASQELWYGLSISAPRNATAVVTGGSECVPNKGNIYGYVFNNDTTFWLTYPQNFVMKAVVNNPVLQYKIYRNEDSVAVVNETEYADYPPEYDVYLYEVKAVWGNQCTEGVFQMVDFRPPCRQLNMADVVTECNSYEWRNGETYTESGTYFYEYTDEEGCPQVDTLILTINHTSYYTDNQVACDSLLWINDTVYYVSTRGPEMVFTNAAGCDSVVTLNLVILNSAVVVDTIVACDSYTWEWNDSTYTESIYGPSHTFTDMAGCENATIILDLTILHSSSSIDSVEACDSYTWKDGKTYTESIDGPVWRCTNAAGCDSVVTLHLTLYHSVQGVDERLVCDSLTWLDDHTYTESTNDPTYTFTSSTGCDSVVTLHLTVKHSSSYVDMIQSHIPYTWIDGVTYSESVYGPTVVLVNSEGCDSVVTLHFDFIVAVDNMDKQYDIKVYPNPSRGIIRIQLPTELSDLPLEARLYDLYGKLLLQQAIIADNPLMDLSRYAQGLYLLQLYHQNQLVGTAKISKSVD